MGLMGAAVVAALFATDGIAADGDAYIWPGYRSDLDYDTKSNLGEIKPRPSSTTTARVLRVKRPASGGPSTGVQIATRALPT